MNTLIKYYLPPILLMLIIFYFSSLPGQVVQITSTPWKEFFIKKMIHILEYAVLWMLTYRAIKQKSSQNRPALFSSLLITYCFAATDEYHQTFIPNRTGMVRDVFIDILGASLACLLIITRYMPEKVQMIFIKLNILDEPSTI